MTRHPALRKQRRLDVYIAHGEQFAWADWEEEYTLYNRATGETHILSVFPVEILKSLSELPADVSTLAERVAALGGIECTTDWVEATTKSLDMLHRLDLVEKLGAGSSDPP